MLMPTRNGSPSELAPSGEQGITPSTSRRSHGAFLSQELSHERGIGRLRDFLRGYWWRMKTMKAAFKESQSGDGSQSRRRSQERLRDKEAWAEGAQIPSLVRRKPGHRQD